MSLCGGVDAAGIRMPLHRFAGTIRRNKHCDDRAHDRLQNPLAQNDVRAGEPSRRWEARWNKWKGHPGRSQYRSGCTALRPPNGWCCDAASPRTDSAGRGVPADGKRPAPNGWSGTLIPKRPLAGLLRVASVDVSPIYYFSSGPPVEASTAGEALALPRKRHGCRVAESVAVRP